MSCKAWGDCVVFRETQHSCHSKTHNLVCSPLGVFACISRTTPLTGLVASTFFSMTFSPMIFVLRCALRMCVVTLIVFLPRTQSQQHPHFRRNRLFFRELTLERDGRRPESFVASRRLLSSTRRNVVASHPLCAIIHATSTVCAVDHVVKALTNVIVVVRPANCSHCAIVSLVSAQAL